MKYHFPSPNGTSLPQSAVSVKQQQGGSDLGKQEPYLDEPPKDVANIFFTAPKSA